MTYYLIEPEVAGGWGDEFEIDRTTQTATRVHYEVADWLGNCIVTSHPVYLVLRRPASLPSTASRSRLRVCGSRLPRTSPTPLP